MSSKWMTSDRRVADSLSQDGFRMKEPRVEGLVLYYVFDYTDALADAIVAAVGEVDEEQEVWTTDDMLAVAYLKVNGVSPHGTKWRGNSLYWIFNDSDKMADLCAEYLGVITRPVDLRLYNEQVAELRRSMLEHRDERRRSTTA